MPSIIYALPLVAQPPLSPCVLPRIIPPITLFDRHMPTKVRRRLGGPYLCRKPSSCAVKPKSALREILADPPVSCARKLAQQSPSTRRALAQQYHGLAWRGTHSRDPGGKHTPLGARIGRAGAAGWVWPRLTNNSRTPGASKTTSRARAMQAWSLSYGPSLGAQCCLRLTAKTAGRHWLSQSPR
ncbi:hypothetical protein GQ53DRAFT_175889 [Thozetella sp. PMI_491]|nr:hypothetical protein GQ53DRAFT_175889 [Thozetella sp. PMI_491]